MSLIRMRRDRKKAHIDATRARSPGLLIVLLVIVGVAIWIVPQWIVTILP